MPKRKVFISYHHGNEQQVVDDFCRMFCHELEVFTDRSLDRAANSDNVEYLNQVCRDAIDGTSVTIVVLGTQTGFRKFVDWEIRYSLHCQHGLFAISRPGLIDSAACLPDRLIDNYHSGYAQWYQYPTSAVSLQQMIDQAFAADSRKINNSRPKMTRNRSW